MRTMHLFAGAGGGLLADLILGHTPIIAVEWDSYACQVLRERAAEGWFPELQVFEGDVRLFYPSGYEGIVDCIHAGFPCQDISVAGNQAGVGVETRSGLYREVLRIAGLVRPRFLFLENVSAIVSNGLGTVVADLAALGYDVEWLCLRASYCGAPHHRDRWWCLATHADSNQRRTSCMGQDARADGRDDVSGICEVLADAERIGQQGSRKHEQSICSTEIGDRETDRIINGGQRNVGWWDAEPDVGRVANGVAFRIHRLKALGNGQVPLQAAVSWKLLGGL
jgi:DNA (cytosine-5)-methyltransferase 1